MVAIVGCRRQSLEECQRGSRHPVSVRWLGRV